MWFARFRWDAWQAAAMVTFPAGLRVYRSEDGTEGCAYWPALELPLALPLDAPASKLEPLLELAGASSGLEAPWHYIVATDVLDEHEAEFNAWYDQEHLPGLAAVPGTVSAARYVVTEGAGPRYHACYDLAERSAFNSGPWRAVRGTPWSSHVRPAFRNTLRTMFARAL